MEEMKATKCPFCEKREVKQQKWKTDIEKKYCMTCLVFLKYVNGLEKTLEKQMELMGIHKNIVIEIRKLLPEEKFLKSVGLCPDTHIPEIE